MTVGESGSTAASMVQNYNVLFVVFTGMCPRALQVGMTVGGWLYCSRHGAELKCLVLGVYRNVPQGTTGWDDCRREWLHCSQRGAELQCLVCGVYRNVPQGTTGLAPAPTLVSASSVTATDTQTTVTLSLESAM